MDILEKVKVLLGIEDNLQDDLLEVIQSQTEEHFKQYAKTDKVPESCQFIIVDVMVKRFNRLGAEGLKSRSIEGASSTYDEHDLEPYDDIINGLNKAVKGVKFL